jgi:ribose transport system permease protein
VPSLESIRKQVPGNWKTVRVKVIERDLPEIGIPAPFIILVLVAVAAGIFLNQTIYGRYLLALGRNEEAAKYSGINTSRMIILAYVICSLCAGLGGLLFVLDVNSAQPVDFGNFYELYAIAAAVLGGCSLRGGEGTILGVVIGAALMRVLKNMITLVDWIPTHIEYAIIGAVILAGVTADELVKRIAANRRAAALRKEA